MVGPSKILTVSYGTFSCTLEGFDDPFSTMRGIAEYFRDLAADDRYFGAEPPTPDAEMLHRIAEREVNRRVETQLKDDGIVLRQVEDRSEAPAPEADDEADADAEPEGSNLFADIASPAPVSGDPASLTAKLSRIRAVVGAGAAGTTATAAFTGSIDAAFADIEPEDEAVLLDPVELELGGDEADAEAGAFEDEAIAAVTEETAEDPVEAAPAAEAPEWDLGEEYALEPEDIPAALESDAKPVAEPAGPEAGSSGHEDEATGFDAIGDNAAMEAATEAADIPELAAMDGVEAGEAALPVEMDAGEDDTPEWSAVGEMTDEAQAELEPATDWDDEDEDEDEDEVSAAPAEAMDDADALPGEDDLAEMDEDTLEPVTAAQDDTRADGPIEAGLEPQADAEAGAETEADAEDDESRLGLAARIVKLKRAAMELTARPQIDEQPIPSAELINDLRAGEDAPDETTGLSQDTVESALFGDAPDVFDMRDGEDDTTVAEDDAWEDDEGDDWDEDDAGDWDEEEDEDEDDARSASAASDAEASMLAAIAAATRAAPAAEDKDPEEAPQRAPRPKSVAFTPEVTGEDSEDSFDRILEQTNTRMDESEGNRRRSAIAHLKAAVAATKADRLLKRRGDPAHDAEEQSQYRDDLAQVVRPQRPTTEPRTLTERPARLEAATPLMLVSELRVDEAAGGQRPLQGVLPRRIAREQGEMATSEADEQSFAEFAESMGATELPDLLEAAAAYSAFVEGRREFSRPQLMRRVANFEQDGFTREAGLRSFGQLLRQGKLQKLKRGQFTVTENCRFNPEARIAGE